MAHLECNSGESYQVSNAFLWKEVIAQKLLSHEQIKQVILFAFAVTLHTRSLSDVAFIL